ncbi:MAG: DUF2797 domain-containing protein [Methylovulum sp.]|nr:DUF2797 domain-containing protein [Methylovulum sp.]
MPLPLGMAACCAKPPYDLITLCQPELAELKQRFGEQALMPLPDEPVIDIQFPVDVYPAKIKSRCLIKTPDISGVLQGIKGQYLIMDTGVINIRKYSGYEVGFA